MIYNKAFGANEIRLAQYKCNFYRICMHVKIENQYNIILHHTAVKNDSNYKGLDII